MNRQHEGQPLEDKLLEVPLTSQARSRPLFRIMGGLSFHGAIHEVAMLIAHLVIDLNLHAKF